MSENGVTTVEKKVKKIRKEQPEGVKEVGKRYKIDARLIVENPNTRNPLAGDMSGYTLFTGTWEKDLDLWSLGVSENPEDGALFCKLFEDGDPDFVAWATTFLTVGQLEPVEVMEKKGGKYTLVFGARRSLAILYNWNKLGRKGIPWIDAQILEKSGETAVTHRSITENTQRLPNPIETAQALQMLLNQGQDVKEVARVYGRTGAWVKWQLKLLKLPQEQQKKIAAGTLRPTKAIQKMQEEESGEEKIPKLSKYFRAILAPLLDFRRVERKDGEIRMVLSLSEEQAAVIMEVVGGKKESEEEETEETGE